MSSSLFWGIILILIGLSLIIKLIFNVDFSIIRVLFAFLFIYLGIKLFVGSDFKLFHDRDNEDRNVIFGEKKIDSLEGGKEYNVIFGGGKFDLRNMSIPDSQSIRVELNTVFGGSQIIIDPEIPIQIISHTVLGGTKLPNGNSSAFGNLYYENDSAKVNMPRLIIEANTVFGGLEIKEKDSIGKNFY